MATYNKDKLALVSQGIKGSRIWKYTDTGLLLADVDDVAGFFTYGYDAGMRQGDQVMVTDSVGRQYGFTVGTASDTGATQVSLGVGALIGDTS